MSEEENEARRRLLDAVAVAKALTPTRGRMWTDDEREKLAAAIEEERAAWVAYCAIVGIWHPEND